MQYTRLDPAQILKTAQTLERRIAERFPDAGLTRVAKDLITVARDTASDADGLATPIWWLRTVVLITITGGAAVFAFVGTLLPLREFSELSLGVVQSIESLLNTLVLGGIGLFALLKLEERLKRKAVFRGLHGLRSLIHIIDMHQLTKDPVALSQGLGPTASSPKRTFSEAELKRYLDYCSEMLSLTGKLAALYAQSFNDSVVIEAVNDIENLGSSLSRKIWQKIMLIGPDSVPPVKRPKTRIDRASR